MPLGKSRFLLEVVKAKKEELQLFGKEKTIINIK